MYNTWESDALKQSELTKLLTYYMILVGQKSGLLGLNFNENDAVENAKFL
jgi:type II secretory pathway component PulF